jgi:hypothetical protein
VTAITRAKAALIFPTAILVRCGDIKYLFASFLNREQVYRLMFRVWQSVLMGTVSLVQSAKIKVTNTLFLILTYVCMYTHTSYVYSFTTAW